VRRAEDLTVSRQREEKEYKERMKKEERKKVRLAP
jgi:hypothetical protein